MPRGNNTGGAANSSKKKKGPSPAHQNKFAYRHNPKSKTTARILSSPNVHVCRRCHEKIEWRKQYRKYKPRTQAGKCNICGQKNVMAAYHSICAKCSQSSTKAKTLLGQWNCRQEENRDEFHARQQQQGVQLSDQLFDQKEYVDHLHEKELGAENKEMHRRQRERVGTGDKHSEVSTFSEEDICSLQNDCRTIIHASQGEDQSTAGGATTIDEQRQQEDKGARHGPRLLDDDTNRADVTLRDAESHADMTGRRWRRRYVRICAVCVKESALPASDDEETETEATVFQKLSLRQRKQLERQEHKKASSRASVSTSVGNDAAKAAATPQRHGQEEDSTASSVDNTFGHSDDDTDDDDTDDPFLRAVGGSSNLLTGEAYQRKRLEELQLAPQDEG